METTLGGALSFLPEVKSCCFVIDNLKLAAAISSVTLFIFHNNALLRLWVFYHPSYHHWGSAIAAIHSTVLYIETIFSIALFFINIIVLFTFCADMRRGYGLLFVLVSLLSIPFEVIWIVIAGARAFVDPGLLPIPHFEKNLCKIGGEKTNMSCGIELVKVTYDYDYLMFVLLLPIILYIYLLIVVYSHFANDSDEA